MSHNMPAISARLRQAGFRVTPQRQMILDAVCKLGGHVTPEAVYAEVRSITPAINRATVYRALHFLTEQQILAEMALPNGRTGYEIAGETPHHHLVCRQCERSMEIEDRLIRPLAAEIKAQYDFALDMRHVTFLGLCAECRGENGD